MKRIKINYTTSDGEVFENERDAEGWQNFLNDIDNFLENSCLYTQEKEIVFTTLKEHYKIIYKILKSHLE